MAPTPEDRFARLKTDPRFRRPKQKQLKVEIDDRFKDVLESEEFGGKGKGKGKASDVKVDKRGRPLAGSHHQDQLKRFYRLRSASPSASGSGDAAGAEAAPTFVDYARGDGYLSSSGSEDEEEESEAEEEELEIGGKRRVAPRPGYDAADDSDSSEGSEASGSHLDIDLEENEESAFPLEVIGEGEDEEEEDDGPTTDPTVRIAAVNLDWDNLRASDLFAVFNSFLKEGGRKIKGAPEMKGEGKLLGVKIYPSEFGKERMKREEMEGPGGGMFLSKSGEGKSGKGKGKSRREREEKSDEESGSEMDDESGDEMESGSDDGLVELDSDDEDQDGDDLSDEEEDDDEEEEEESEDDGLPASGKAGKLDIMSDVSSDAGSEDIDMDQLRQYQLERLRYYYAIATFSTVAAAEHVMAECNGTEFERTANVMDLSYVPDGMDFSDDELHDEATKEPRGYKGTDFVTDALRHSKVKLTWDQDDPNRSKLTRKALTREEIEEQDFKNLVAGSDDSGSESDDASELDDGAGDMPIGVGTGAAVGKGGKGKKGDVVKGADVKAKKAKVKERKDKLRALLLAGNEEDGDIWGKAGLGGMADMADGDEAEGGGKGGMEITFRPALAEGGPALEDDNLTTLERYQLRMKEKKSRKKEKLEMRRGMKEGDAEDGVVEEGKKVVQADDFFGGESEEEAVEEKPKSKKEAKVVKPTKEKATTVPSSTKPLPSAMPTKPTPVSAAIPADVHSDLQPGDDKEHFSMKDIIKDEKGDGKRRRKRASQAKKEARAEALGRTRETELGQEGWKIDVKDSRFKALHEEPEFAIDPSNPHFTKTKAMKDLLAERARVREGKRKDGPSGRDEAPAERVPKKAVAGAGGPKERDLTALVQSVKRKMENGPSGAAAKSGRKRHRK